MPDFAIAPGEAHVWVADPAAVSEGEAARLARTLLSAAERARMRRLLWARDRQLLLVSHALLRLALSRCAPQVAPAAWTFTTTRHGRPELPPPWAALRFNLSHTDGLVAVVVTRDVDCGIDVEGTERREVGPLATHVLAPSELRAVAAAPAASRTAVFLRYWTLKEAYAKARGLGLALPFEQCVFAIHGQRIRLVDHPVDPDPGGWCFVQWMPTQRHILALALRPAPHDALHLTSHPTAEPLGTRQLSSVSGGKLQVKRLLPEQDRNFPSYPEESWVLPGHRGAAGQAAARRAMSSGV